MGVSVDGFIVDRAGAFGWTVPSEDQFRFHIAQIRELGGYLCGRRLYETMLPWEMDPSLRDNAPGAQFADVEIRTFGGRVVYERYGRAGDESD